MSQAALFQPFKVGRLELKHRVVMAPLTRFRADEQFVPTDLMAEYYRQRASTPGTLLITEATFISKRAGLYANAPGIWSKEQVAAWKKVTDAVHGEGSYIYVQLWNLGRAADPKLLEKEGYDLVSSGDIPLNGNKPRPVTKEEIKTFVQDYEQAAKNAIEAGFDGVELHNANGYLLDQFLQYVANNRTDEYGGSVENRARFTFEVLEAITNAIGQDRTGIRFSPFSKFQDMGMADPVPQFKYVAEQLAQRYPNLAYLHAVESRISAGFDAHDDEEQSLAFLKEAWGDRVFLRAGGYKRDKAIMVAHDEPKTAIVVGRLFISNPDLPRRWKKDVPVEPYDRSSFYLPMNPHGYTTYKAATEVDA